MTATWSIPSRSAHATARRNAPGARITSASLKSSHVADVASEADCSAWVLPSQPPGNSRTWTTRSRSSSAAIASRIAPVASVERSSTAITSSPG